MPSRKQILVVLSRVPYPFEKGDKLRAYHQIRCLAQFHDVHLVALSDGRIDKLAIPFLQQMVKSIQVYNLSRMGIWLNILRAWLTGLPLQVGYFYNVCIARKIRRHAGELDLDHAYFQLIRTAEYAKEIGCPKTLDYQDVFSEGARRQASRAKWWMRPILQLEYRRLLKYERAVFDRFDHHTIISIPDRDLIPHPDKDKIEVVPNGVDTEYFTPTARPKPFHVLFTGNMGYPPNVDACRFLVKEIMPLVWQEVPGLKVMLAGATPHPEVRALASDRVTVTGWMDDIRTAYASSQVFIAPMRIGTGLQNKILEAMSMELPSITTPLAYSALHEDADGIVSVGETPESLAQHILRFAASEQLSAETGRSSRQFVIQHYNWETATRRMEQFCSSPVEF